MPNKKLAIIPIIYMLILFGLSSMPLTPDAHSNMTVRKIVQNGLHVPAFGLLAFLWLRFFKKRGLAHKKAVFYTIALTLAYAVFDEAHQYFVPGRCMSFFDLLMDTAGCLGGIFIWLF